MKKKYYLYHQQRTLLLGITFVLWDTFDTLNEATEKMKEQASIGLWRIWKIEEAWEFDQDYRGYTNLMP